MPSGDQDTPEESPARIPTVLDRWMRHHRVTANELASMTGLTGQYLNYLRRGIRVPSDEAKVSIAGATLSFERERGLARPHGVTVLCWYLDLEDAILGIDERVRVGLPGWMR